jgi:transcriptional regulator with XRE-family HTH domain
MSKETNQSADETDGHPDNYLREWREFMGWSQEELGDMAEVHYSTIGRIESGKRKLKTRFLRQLAEIFRVPASALLDVNPSTESGKQTAHMLLAWDRLSPSQRNDVLKMVRALAPPDDKSNAS